MSKDLTNTQLSLFLFDNRYHRGDSNSMYEWILSKDIRKYSPKIEPYVDKNYSIGDKSTRFRAIRLKSPPISLNGVYECSVQSLGSHDIKTTELIVYGMK